MINVDKLSKSLRNSRLYYCLEICIFDMKALTKTSEIENRTDRHFSDVLMWSVPKPDCLDSPFLDSPFLVHPPCVRRFSRVRIVVRTGCLFAIGEASEGQGRILVGTNKNKIGYFS